MTTRLRLLHDKFVTAEQGQIEAIELPGSTALVNGVLTFTDEEGVNEPVAHGAMGATETIDWSASTVHSGTLDANCTFTFTAPLQAGQKLYLTLTQDGTGSRTGTWPGTVVGTPIIDPTAAAVTVLEFLYDGTNYNFADSSQPAPMAANTIKANATAATATPQNVALAANKFLARSSAGNIAAKDITDFALTILDDANAAAALTTLGAQPLDTELTALAGLTSAADKLPYFTGSGTAALADLSASARTLLDDASVHAMLLTLLASKAYVRASVNGSDQVVTFNVETTVDYDAEQIDTQSEFNTGTNTYTAGATRTLRVYATVGSDSGAGDVITIRIKKNGSEVAKITHTCPTGSDEVTIPMSDIVQVVATDTITVTYHNSGGTRTIRGGTTRSFLTIEEV